MARPKKAVLKSKQIKVHCTRNDLMVIEAKAKSCKLTKSEFLLKAALGVKLKRKLSDSEIKLFYELVGLGNNLNQIAKQLNEHQILGVRALEDLERFRNIMKKFK